jgi:hypothetical protein
MRPMATANGPRQHLRVTACVVASFHDEGAVFFHKRDGRVFASNPAGARIWQGLEKRLTLGAIADELSREYAIAIVTASADAERFVADLERWGLIERGAHQ